MGLYYFIWACICNFTAKLHFIPMFCELYLKIFKNFLKKSKLLTIFTKKTIIDVSVREL